MEMDRFARAHAHVEYHIGHLGDSGLERLPFSDVDPNSVWLALVGFAADMVRWFHLLCLRGDLRRAESKTLRWERWHAPARPICSGRRDHPARARQLANALFGAHRRMALLFFLTRGSEPKGRSSHRWTPACPLRSPQAPHAPWSARPLRPSHQPTTPGRTPQLSVSPKVCLDEGPQLAARPITRADPNPQRQALGGVRLPSPHPRGPSGSAPNSSCSSRAWRPIGQ